MVLTQDVEVFYASETIGDYLGVSQVMIVKHFVECLAKNSSISAK